MIQYEVYEYTNAAKTRRVAQARFKHQDHANMFCDMLKGIDPEYPVFVTAIMVDDDHADDTSDLFKVRCAS